MLPDELERLMNGINKDIETLFDEMDINDYDKEKILSFLINLQNKIYSKISVS